MFSFSSDLFCVGRIELTHWGGRMSLTSVTWCFGQHFSSIQKVSDVQFLGVKRLKTIFFRTLFGNSIKRLVGSFLGHSKFRPEPVQFRGSAKRWHGPLSDICGALWVFLQGFHDLTVVQHQSHELVLLLGLCGGAVDRADEFQLLQVLEGLWTEGRTGQDWWSRVRVLDDDSERPSWWRESQSCKRSLISSAGTS